MKKIILTQRKIALIDNKDFPIIKQRKWCVQHPERKQTYAVSRINGRVIPMHRLLLKLNNPKIMSDHKDGNGLNNQRYNLRITDNQHNSMNQRLQLRPKGSKYKGVHWDKERNYWIAQIKLNQKPIFLGRFNTQKEAAKAYNKKALELFKDFARLNDI